MVGVRASSSERPIESAAKRYGFCMNARTNRPKGEGASSPHTLGYTSQTVHMKSPGGRTGVLILLALFSSYSVRG